MPMRPATTARERSNILRLALRRAASIRHVADIIDFLLMQRIYTLSRRASRANANYFQEIWRGALRRVRPRRGMEWTYWETTAFAAFGQAESCPSHHLQLLQQLMVCSWHLGQMPEAFTCWG
jgi:hypothetical protein